MMTRFKTASNNCISHIMQAPLAGGLLPLALFLIPAIMFMQHQSLWVDETTQLSGLSLGPLELLKWLTHHKNPFQVPSDAAPPMSYWLGQIWSSIFGLSEISLRWFGLFTVCLALLVVYETGRKAFGLRVGMIAALLFGLSPNIIEQSVNIRSYPLFLLFSSFGFYFLVRISEDPNRQPAKWLAGLVVSSLLASYTHFFGVLLAGSLFLAALITIWRAKGPLGPVIICIAVTFAGSLGLIPILYAAAKMLSQHLTISSDGYLISIARLIYRQIAHPAIAVSTPMVFVALLGVTILLVAAIILLKTYRSNPRRAIFNSLTSGAIVIIIGRFTVSALMTQPHYNLWIQPGLLLLIASSLLVKNKKLMTAGVIALCMIIASFVYGDFQLMANGRYFSHTRYSDIKRVVNEFNLDELAIVQTGDWAGAVYFPLVYEYGNNLNQYFLIKRGHEPPFLSKPPDLKVKSDFSSINAANLMVIDTEQRSANDIARYIHGHKAELSDGRSLSVLPITNEWILIKEERFISFGDTRISIYKRADCVNRHNSRGHAS